MRKNPNPKRILMTGGRAPAALALARILWRAGHKIFMAESAKIHVSRRSRAISKNFLVPPPSTSGALYADALAQIIQKHKIDLVIPANEETFYVSKHRPRLSQLCEVFTDDFQKLDRLHNKWTFNQHAKSLGFTVPQTTLVTSRSALAALVRRHPKKLVLKPAYSRFGQDVCVRPSDPRVTSKFDVSPKRPWLAQAFVEGMQICTYSVARNGKLAAHVAYETHYVIGAGTNVHFKAVHLPAARQWVEKFVQLENFTGQIAFDLFRQPGGQLLPIECNPRATNGIFLFRNRDNLASAFTQTTTTNCIDASLGHDAMLELPMLAWGIKALALPHQDFSAWARSMINARGALFSLRDPLPMFLQYVAFFDLLRKSRHDKIDFASASVDDIGWNG